jgi:hypothetical protein
VAALVIGAGGLAAAWASPAPAATAAEPALSAANTVITAFSAPGDYVGRGISNEFDATNASVTGTATTSGISLQVLGGTTGHSWGFELDPPVGTTFHVGNYPDTVDPALRSGTAAGLSIGGGGNGCDNNPNPSGPPSSIEIRDLATSGSTITRLDLLYVQYCDASPGALFGEIRIGEPQPAGLLVSSSSITWSPTWLGGPLTAPVTIRNRGAKPVAISAARLTGYGAARFRVSANTCSGKALAPRASCTLTLTLEPSGPGPRTAALQIGLGKTLDTIQLDAALPMGTTSLTMSSQPGDFVGSGRNWSYTTGNASFFFRATPTGLTDYVFTAGGLTDWVATMNPAAGHTLTVGDYPDATMDGSGNYLEVSGDGHGCDTDTGEFTILQAVFAGQALRHFDATFTQHCEGASPALTGEIKYDSAPVVTAPPTVGKLTATGRGGKIALAWKNPALSRYRYTVVRVEPGRPGGVAPTTGVAAYEGTGQGTTITGLSARQQYTIGVFTVDQYGNVSAPAELAVTG